MQQEGIFEIINVALFVTFSLTALAEGAVRQTEKHDRAARALTAVNVFLLVALTVSNAIWGNREGFTLSAFYLGVYVVIIAVYGIAAAKENKAKQKRKCRPVSGRHEPVQTLDRATSRQTKKTDVKIHKM